MPVNERRAFLGWISRIKDFEDFHDSTLKKRHKQSGTWLIQTKEFNNWLTASQSNILWCFGGRKYNIIQLVILVALPLYTLSTNQLKQLGEASQF